MRKHIAGMLLVLGAVSAGPVISDDEPAASAPVAAGAAKPRAPEQLQLETTSIRGNQELPKVLYILPWKEPGAAGPAGAPLDSLVEEALAPVDREVFRRQLRYFDQLYGGAESKPDQSK